MYSPEEIQKSQECNQFTGDKHKKRERERRGEEFEREKTEQIRLGQGMV